jgi:hypothetical protein
LLVDNGIGDVFPKLEGFIRELLSEGRDILGNGKEGVEIDEDEFFLKMGEFVSLIGP